MDKNINSGSQNGVVALYYRNPHFVNQPLIFLIFYDVYL